MNAGGPGRPPRWGVRPSLTSGEVAVQMPCQTRIPKTPPMRAFPKRGVDPRLENQILSNYFISLLYKDLRRKNAGGMVQITLGNLGKLVPQLVAK